MGCSPWNVISLVTWSMHVPLSGQGGSLSLSGRGCVWRGNLCNGRLLVSTFEQPSRFVVSVLLGQWSVCGQGIFCTDAWVAASIAVSARLLSTLRATDPARTILWPRVLTQLWVAVVAQCWSTMARSGRLPLVTPGLWSRQPEAGGGWLLFRLSRLGRTEMTEKMAGHSCNGAALLLG